MTTRSGNKSKAKKQLQTTLGKALPTKSSEVQLDLSSIRRPIDTSVFGLKQVLSLFETATDEVRRYITYECDMLYECRVCRSLFRSLANFILHKRNYCRENYEFANEDSGFKQTNWEIISEDTPEETCDQLQSGENSPPEVTLKLPQRKDLEAVVRNLFGKQETSCEEVSTNVETADNNKRTNKVALENIESNSSGVFQTLQSKPIGLDLMKSEVMEIHSILNSNEAILGPDGKIVTPQTDDRKGKQNVQKKSLTCAVCNMNFSTKKTLTYHIKYKHNDTRVVYFCPECKDTFANAWCVFRHLYKIHRKTTTQIRKMRDQIHSSTVVKKQSLIPKKKYSRELENLDHENQWMNDIEGDNDLQMCGGCGKRFERKAALNSHSQLCMKRLAVCNSIRDNKRIQVEEKLSKLKAPPPKPKGAMKRKMNMYGKTKRYVNPKGDTSTLEKLLSQEEEVGGEKRAKYVIISEVKESEKEQPCPSAKSINEMEYKRTAIEEIIFGSRTPEPSEKPEASTSEKFCCSLSGDEEVTLGFSPPLVVQSPDGDTFAAPTEGNSDMFKGDITLPTSSEGTSTTGTFQSSANEMKEVESFNNLPNVECESDKSKGNVVNDLPNSVAMEYDKTDGNIVSDLPNSVDTEYETHNIEPSATITDDTVSPIVSKSTDHVCTVDNMEHNTESSSEEKFVADEIKSSVDVVEQSYEGSSSIASIPDDIVSEEMKCTVEDTVVEPVDLNIKAEDDYIINMDVVETIVSIIDNENSLLTEIPFENISETNDKRTHLDVGSELDKNLKVTADVAPPEINADEILPKSAPKTHKIIATCSDQPIILNCDFKPASEDEMELINFSFSNAKVQKVYLPKKPKVNEIIKSINNDHLYTQERRKMWNPTSFQTCSISDVSKNKNDSQINVDSVASDCTYKLAALNIRSEFDKRNRERADSDVVEVNNYTKPVFDAGFRVTVKLPEENQTTIFSEMGGDKSVASEAVVGDEKMHDKVDNVSKTNGIIHAVSDLDLRSNPNIIEIKNTHRNENKVKIKVVPFDKLREENVEKGQGQNIVTSTYSRTDHELSPIMSTCRPDDSISMHDHEKALTPNNTQDMDNVIAVKQTRNLDIETLLPKNIIQSELHENNEQVQGPAKNVADETVEVNQVKMPDECPKNDQDLLQPIRNVKHNIRVKKSDSSKLSKTDVLKIVNIIHYNNLRKENSDEGQEQAKSNALNCSETDPGEDSIKTYAAGNSTAEHSSKRRKVEKKEETLTLKCKTYIDIIRCVCIPCQLKFSSKTSLMRHMSLHFNWFHYQCSRCSFMSYDKTTCHNHVRSHTIIPAFANNIVLPIPYWKTLTMSTDFVNKILDSTYGDQFDAGDETDTFRDLGTSLHPESGNDAAEATPTYEEDCNLQSIDKNDPRLHNLIMKVIFGSPEIDSTNQAHSSTCNSNVRPVRNRTHIKDSDFVYDMEKIDLGKKERKIPVETKVRPIKIVKSTDTDFKVVRVTKATSHKKKKISDAISGNSTAHI